MKPKNRSGFFAALLMMFGLTSQATMATEIGIDHFKVYDIRPVSVQAKIATKGQFDDDTMAAKLYRLFRYATPVSKNGEPMLDHNAHLSWYLMREDAPTIPRVVKFENQFGVQKLITGPAAALLAPSEKHEKGSAFPKALDHYKCYHVYEGAPVEKFVTLKDQFGAEKNLALMPRYFCVPVLKKHGDKVFKIFNEKAHLVFYDLRPTPYEVTRKISDQFGSRGIYIVNSALLGVPSVKLSFDKL